MVSGLGPCWRRESGRMTTPYAVLVGRALAYRHEVGPSSSSELALGAVLDDEDGTVFPDAVSPAGRAISKNSTGTVMLLPLTSIRSNNASLYLRRHSCKSSRI